VATVSKQPANRLILHGVDWKTYTRLLRALDGRPSLRLTYDRGLLEIMNLTFGHESDDYLLGRFVDALTEELRLPIAGGGSTTFRRKRKRRGLEPDNCYWVAHEPLVRGKRRIDLRVDPPPDLAIEVDILHSSLNRMSIYAALRVPEVWRFDGHTVGFHILQPDGSYTQQAHSCAFPLLSSTDLMGILALRGQVDANSIVAQFRAWVRQQLPPGAGTAPTP
jgi:Uma2 family endonuclease